MSSSHSYPHEPTGVETRKLGMWVFLSTEILFFGTLITTFMIFKGRDFPGIKLTDVYDIPFTSISSFILLMSSLTMVLAHNALEANDQEKTRVWLLATAMLGAVFLAGQIYEFTEFYHKGFELSTNIFSSTFYVLTGFHGLHVFIGVVLLLALWGIGQRQKGLTLEGGMNLEFVALYWHFVDIVWIVLFTVVYLIAIVLGILTAIEIALYYTEDIVGVFTDPILIILAVGKFIIVVGWFMHLRFENKMVNRFFTGGMILALVLFAIVMIERASANFS